MQRERTPPWHFLSSGLSRRALLGGLAALPFAARAATRAFREAAEDARIGMSLAASRTAA